MKCSGYSCCNRIIGHFFYKPTWWASKFTLITSAVGTILFIAQGIMRTKPEMKPWVHTEEKDNELRWGAALSARTFAYVVGSAAPVGSSINVFQWLTQGLRPGLWKGIALKGSSRFSSPINYLVILMCLLAASTVLYNNLCIKYYLC